MLTRCQPSESLVPTS